MSRLILMLTIVAVGISLSIAAGCERPDAPAFSNPLDPTDPNYVPPLATITAGPDDGETVADADVTFSWSGVDRVDAYRYRLDEADWAAWLSTTTVEFQLLDEGEHIFAVMGRYPTGDEQTEPTTRTFIVDAVEGPALMFRPRRIVVKPGDRFSVDVVAEEVEDLLGARVRIVYDQELRLQVVGEGTFLAENGGRVVFLSENDSGALTVDTAVAEGMPTGVTGSGAIATLVFSAQGEGDASLVYADDSVLRNSENQDIPLSTRVDGSAVVREETP